MNDFLSKLYELFGFSYGFSDKLYHEGVYSTTALYSVLIAFCSVVIMYYVYFNWLRITNSQTAWFSWIIATCIICAIVAYTISHSTLHNLYAQKNTDMPYSFGEFFKFSIINAFWVFIICWVFSVTIKSKSPHGKATPHLWPNKKTKTKNDIN